MGDFEPKVFEKYLIFPNESIDRLTVNRPFQRIYEDIENRINSSEISLVDSTDIIYGKAKFTSSDEFIFDDTLLTESNSAGYYNDILTINTLNNYAISLYDTVSSSIYFAAPSGNNNEFSKNNYWVKTDYSDVDFSYIQNGVNCITGTFEIGFNNVKTVFGGTDYILSGDISSPVVVSSYDMYMKLDSSDEEGFKDFVENGSRGGLEDDNSVYELRRLDGLKIDVPFFNNFQSTLKNNICKWTTYSSFNQSIVELNYSSSIDMKSLYESKYGKDTFIIYDTTNTNVLTGTKTASLDTRVHRHPKMTFEQKPIIMMQIGFYSNDALQESRIRPIFGIDNRFTTKSEPISSTFKNYSTMSIQPLTLNSLDEELSPVDGFVMLKEFENEYDEDGLVTNNIIHFDVIMKFVVGSAADPKMIHGLTTLNSRARIQFALIGV